MHQFRLFGRYFLDLAAFLSHNISADTYRRFILANPEKFVGRERELSELRKLHSHPGGNIGVVYGRRRVGKTELIRRAFSKQRLYSFEGVENQAQQKQITNFLVQLEVQTGKKIARKSSYRSWSEALTNLIPLTREGPVVFLLDEFQWMANYRTDLALIPTVNVN